jgi:hypothetical protein
MPGRGSGSRATEMNPMKCPRSPIADIADREKWAVSDSFGGQLVARQASVHISPARLRLAGLFLLDDAHRRTCQIPIGLLVPLSSE